MGELKFLNQKARQYAERREVVEPRRLPDLALLDIQVCAIIDHLDYVPSTLVSEARADALEQMGTESVLWEIGQFYGFSPSEVREVYDQNLIALDGLLEVEAS